MVNNSEILSAIDKAAPFSIAADWDNVGLLLDMKNKSDKILFSLDLTYEAISEAKELGCGAVVCHHPAIFGTGLRKIDGNDPVIAAAANGISVFAAHTNWDGAQAGVNDVLCKLLGLSDVSPLGIYARMGTCPEMSAVDLAMLVKNALGIPAVHLCNSGKSVSHVAVVGGSGGDFVSAAAAAGCTALVTGECKHSDGLLARRLGVSVIAAGHYETENPSVPALAAAVAAELSGKAECIVARRTFPVFMTV